MSSALTYLPDIWLGIIGLLLLLYVFTDGANLGIGILSLFENDGEEVGRRMGMLGSTWHASQTWLVILGGMLFGAFPDFYGILLSALYVPMVLMLAGLIFRGVAFEFRAHSGRKRAWELAFGLGSLVATLAQGAALGGLLSGLPVENGRFEGSIWGWFNPFSALVAAGVLCGYVLLGSNYLIATGGEALRQRGYRHALASCLLTFPISAAVHLWAAARYPQVADKWITGPWAWYLWGSILLALASFWRLMSNLLRRRRSALRWNYAVICFSFFGLSVGLYPDMIPSVVNPVAVAHAAASPQTLLFMLVVTAILLPVILGYTAYTHRAAVRSGRAYGGDEEEGRPPP